MPFVVVWMDREQAKLFEFSNEKMQRENIQVLEPAQLVNRLKGAGRILITGPGLVIDRFKRYIEANAASLAKRIVGYETLVDPSDSLIATLAIKHFRL